MLMLSCAAVVVEVAVVQYILLYNDFRGYVTAAFQHLSVWITDSFSFFVLVEEVLKPQIHKENLLPTVLSQWSQEEISSYLLKIIAQGRNELLGLY